MSLARDQIVETTCGLLEAQGYHATGLNQIVKESGSPKGSLYYYFPGGKDELIAEAIQRTGQAVKKRVSDFLAQKEDPAEAISDFIRFLASLIETSAYKSGGPITAVAMETASTNEQLSKECSEVYQMWHAVFAEKLVQGGFVPERAASLASLIVAALEGSTLLSRTHKSTRPMLDVAEEIHRLIKQVS
jgi:TetR/AcrR family transcriptional repressor of lmrAB and yxaGH operons